MAEKADGEECSDSRRKNGANEDVSKPSKQPKKFGKEKIRYGQAPEMRCPAGPVTSLGEETATTTAAGAPLQGQAAGVAMALDGGDDHRFLRELAARARTRTRTRWHRK